MIEDKYAYNSVIVARYIVAVANDRKIGINMTKLQKLLYIAYGTYLAVKGVRLTNEHPQAWPYGPVFPTTRNKMIKVINWDDISVKDEEFKEIHSDRDIASLMNLVFDYFGQYNAATLTEWSHKDGSPWERATKQESFKWGNAIPDEFILDYFKSILVRTDATNNR